MQQRMAQPAMVADVELKIRLISPVAQVQPQSNQGCIFLHRFMNAHAKATCEWLCRQQAYPFNKMERYMYY